ncbi:MAG: 30S ribosomal protein S10 [Chloroflexota bacterium]|nr:MAG: 30S ribosomal protein S10 [Chloroflexota bacterium]
MPRRSKSRAPIVQPTRRLQIVLRSVDHRVVDQACLRLTQVAERAGGVVEGPYPLPSAPSSHEGMRTHVRRLDLVDPGAELLGMLRGFDLPSGVEIELAG